MGDRGSGGWATWSVGRLGDSMWKHSCQICGPRARGQEGGIVSTGKAWERGESSIPSKGRDGNIRRVMARLDCVFKEGLVLGREKSG